jgi:UPF0755 protein
MKKMVIFGLVLLVLIIAAVGAKAWYSWQVDTPLAPGHPEEFSFTIEPGESIEQIALRLETEGIIRSAEGFTWYFRFHPEQGNGIQAGDFTVSPRYSVRELAELFQTGIIIKSLTFIEGWRREQMATYLSGQFDREFGEEFLSLTQEKEGQLFPDTYFVGADITPEELVSVMVQTLESKLDAAKLEAMHTQGLALDQLLIVASIVEREVAKKDDRPIVAGILLKRWRNDWLLEADATVQYVMGAQRCQVFDAACDWWPKEITFADLSNDSSYNTRKVAGLPPAPIANPGLAAIEAVLYPTETSYWFYLSDEDGTTYYAETLQQHNQNIELYLQ